jgi:hypothetical protein
MAPKDLTNTGKLTPATKKKHLKQSKHTFRFKENNI